MPFKHESMTLKENGTDIEHQVTALEGLASSVRDLNVMNVKIEGKNTKLSIENSGWRQFRTVDAIMTTKLEDPQKENFFQNLPSFLRNQTSEKGDLDLFISRPLGDSGKKSIDYCIGFTPGYVTPDKQIERNHKSSTFVAIAYYPERKRFSKKAYSGQELDGRWVDWEMNDDLFTKFMRLKGEAERWGFVTSEKRPTADDCEQFVCVHPWEMVEQEFIDFTKAAMLKKETQEMDIACRNIEESHGKFNKVYDFCATLFPLSNNVEVIVRGPAYQGCDVGKMLGKSLDLFDIKLNDKDKISYFNYYERESKTLDAMANAGSAVGSAIASSFAYVGRGFKTSGKAVRNQWRKYQYGKQRKIGNIKVDMDMNRVPVNEHRTGSCYVGIKKACVLRKIQAKEEQAKTYQQKP